MESKSIGKMAFTLYTLLKEETDLSNGDIQFLSTELKRISEFNTLTQFIQDRITKEKLNDLNVKERLNWKI